MARIVMGLLCCLLVVTTGCAKKEEAPTPKDPNIAVTCIGIMPVQPGVRLEGNLTVAAAKKLREGGYILDALIKQKIAGREGYRFVSPSQVFAAQDDQGDSTAVQLQRVAGQISCNAVLEVKINRYSDRIGGRYSAKEPASVSFEYRLYDVENNKVLCHGRYDEVQKSVMENLYNWSRASKRGFTWVTAEELLREGVDEKFEQCGYLMGDE